MASNPRQITSADLIFFINSCPKNLSKNHLNFYDDKTNRLHFSVRVYCNRSQKTSQRVKNNSHTTRLRLHRYVFCSLHAVTSSAIYYSTQVQKNIIYLQIIQRVIFLDIASQELRGPPLGLFSRMFLLSRCFTLSACRYSA